MYTGWIAMLSDGKEFREQWVTGDISPWQKLMVYCSKNNEYVVQLFIIDNDILIASTPKSAQGYWQAFGMPATQGMESDPEIHPWRGIGWIEDERVKIIWSARDYQTHQLGVWTDERATTNQNQIIWSHKNG